MDVLIKYFNFIISLIGGIVIGQLIGYIMLDFIYSRNMNDFYESAINKMYYYFMILIFGPLHIPLYNPIRR